MTTCGQAEDREVIGLRSAGQKNNFCRRGIDQHCNLTSRLLDRGLRALPKRVYRLRVPHFIREIGQHRLDNFGRRGGGRAVVQVDLHRFGVQSSGFLVQGSEFRVQALALLPGISSK